MTFKPTETADGVAVMQPYFYPYPGYFALFAAVSTFVIYDCVQFPRRGRVHRTEIGRDNDEPQWLTLPLARQARDILIRDLRFASGAKEEFSRRLKRSAASRFVPERLPQQILDLLNGELNDVCGYLESNLVAVASLLQLKPRILRSSSLGIDPALRGQLRVLAIAKAVGGSRYVNAPSGRRLYDRDLFAANGIRLEFLPPYLGKHRYLLPALASVPIEELRADVLTVAAGLTPA